MKRSLVLIAFAAAAAGAVVAVLAATHTDSSRPHRVGVAGNAGPYRGTQPPSGIRIPKVTLTSYRGGRVSLRNQGGRVLVVTFLDSRCTDTCPTIGAVIGRTWPSLTSAEKRQVRAYAISVNPRADTRARVRRFLAARHALGALDWLTGSIPRMRPVWHAFGVLPAVDTGNDNVHSADVRVFDRHGQWVSNLHAGVDLTAANLAHDIRLALESRS
jgi:cytochrome oxidase Cu insertion factor (SCO1/SenC/PrrC family)